MDFEIRPAVPADHARIGEIAVDAYRDAGLLPEGADYAVRLRDAAGRSQHCDLIVARDPATEQVLGSVSVCLPGSAMSEIAAGDHELEFRMLSVALDAQGRGVGAALVMACVDEARRRGCESVVLSVADRGRLTSAQRLYLRLGFRWMPERDWFPVPGVRLLAMRLPLTED